MSENKKKGLGRGLSSLFGDAKQKSENITENNFVLVGNLDRNQFQPRLKFNEEKIIQLANSIKKNGIIQPIVVRKNKFDLERYEIIAGERRWIAAQKAGLHEVPVNILNLSDNEALEVSIIENIQREDLNSIEEAKGYERLKKEFGYDQDKIAEMMSKSRSHVVNTLRLLSLPKDLIQMMEEGLATAGQFRPLIGLSNASSIGEEIVKRNLSARMVEQIIKGKKLKLKNKDEQDPNIENIKNNLEGKLGLKVNIKNRKNNSGKITIEYKNLDQFELISTLLKN